jgi:tellurite resistance protein TehA-like permease
MEARDTASYIDFISIVYPRPSATDTRLFLATMGTGIIPILINQVPYQRPWFFQISTIFLILEIILFLILCILSIVRYTIWPGLLFFTMRHPVESLYLHDLYDSSLTSLEAQSQQV